MGNVAVCHRQTAVIFPSAMLRIALPWSALPSLSRLLLLNLSRSNRYSSPSMGNVAVCHRQTAVFLQIHKNSAFSLCSEKQQKPCRSTCTAFPIFDCFCPGKPFFGFKVLSIPRDSSILQVLLILPALSIPRVPLIPQALLYHRALSVPLPTGFQALPIHNRLS